MAQVAKGASGIEQYVHRCGRTGRRAEAGLAVSYYDPVADKNSAAAIADLLRQSGALLHSYRPLSIWTPARCVSWTDLTSMLRST